MSFPSLEEFIKSVKFYQKSVYALDGSYVRIAGRIDIWQNLDAIDDAKTGEIVTFLNIWKCHLYRSVIPKLTQTLIETGRNLQDLRNSRLIDMDLEAIERNAVVIRSIFDRIANTTYQTSRGLRRVGPTATVKILHLVNPDFFMMNDLKIRNASGCSEDGVGYATFMLKTKRFADSILGEYMKRKGMADLEKAFHDLVSESDSHARTLPKLLDEYNWVKFNDYAPAV